jgi:hypothetical protein
MRVSSSLPPPSEYLVYNMPSSDQCAVGTDGTLLDESEIIWYNDAEDSSPISSSPQAATTSNTIQMPPPSTSDSSVSTKATTLHAFFNGTSTPRPAVFVAGARRSSRVSKPSKCVLDANNVEPQAESSKRARVANKKPVQSESEDEASINHDASDVGGDTDVEMEDSVAADSEDAYASTKAMGDQDRKVSAHYPRPAALPLARAYLFIQVLCTRSKSDRTADVRTIFKSKKEHVNAATGHLEDGHVCTVCE